MNCSVAKARERINAARAATETPEHKAAFEAFNGLRIFAIFHDKAGDEVISMRADIDVKPQFSKNALLDFICAKPWAHRMDDVSRAVIAYLALTDSYKKMAPLLATGQYGVEIHFYKNDPEVPGTHSCRQIMAMHVAAWEQKVDTWLAEHADESLVNPHLLNTTGQTVN
jgi:hypothetical protein